MKQILYKKYDDNNIHSSKVEDYENREINEKSIKLIYLLLPVIIFIILLFVSTNIYVSANKDNSLTENNTTNQEIYNEEETQENVNNSTNTNTNISTNTNNSNNTTTYTASNGEKYNIIATLNIPSLGIEYPVLSSTSTELLKISLNKYWGADPNQVGNMVVVGHNYKNTKFFSKLHEIQIGSIVKITDNSGKTLDYKVYKTDIIDPYDNACTSQLTDGHTEITLITCCNNGTQRFIAKARAN